MNLKPPISDYQLGAIFYESILMTPDTIRTRRAIEMQPFEFLVFICRITYEFYLKTPYKNEEMHLKLEAMLPLFLQPVFCTPIFISTERFQYDIKMDKKKERARKKAAGEEDSQEEEDEDDYDDEDSDGKDGPKLKTVEEMMNSGGVVAADPKDKGENTEDEAKEKKKKKKAGESSSSGEDSEEEEKASSISSGTDTDPEAEIEEHVKDDMPKRKFKKVAKKIFLVHDTNDDGIIDSAEFKRFCYQMAKAAGITDYKIEGMKATGKKLTMYHAMFQQFAFNKDGNIAWEEIWWFLKANRN